MENIKAAIRFPVDEDDGRELSNSDVSCVVQKLSMMSSTCLPERQTANNIVDNSFHANGSHYVMLCM